MYSWFVSVRDCFRAYVSCRSSSSALSLLAMKVEVLSGDADSSLEAEMITLTDWEAFSDLCCWSSNSSPRADDLRICESKSVLTRF